MLPLGCALFASAHGDTVATLTAPVLGNSTLESWLEDVFGEAFGEAFCTLAICFGVWVCGNSFGFTFGSDSKKPKKTSKVTASSRHASTATPPRKANAGLAKAKAPRPEPHGSEGATPVSQLRSGSPRQSKGSFEGILTGETDLLAAAVKNGLACDLPRLIDASVVRLSKDAAIVSNAADRGTNIIELLFVASLRACAAKRCFADALAVYAHVKSRITDASVNTWSLLLWSAVEVDRFDLCTEFVEKLLQSGTPTCYDFVNITRYFVHTGDVDGFALAFEKLRKSGSTIDVFGRNRALSVCTNSRRLALACKIVELIPEVPMDAIAHNILMKAYATVGDLTNCFGQYAEMKKTQVKPTEMTFGILLDACTDDNQMNYARRVFSDLRESGLALNAILYTTFIKGLVNAGALTEVMEILDEMCEQGTAKPDLVTFSTVVKAHASVGNVMECVRLLERMQKIGVEADAVLYNTVLTGCCYKPMEPAQVMHILSWLVNKGLQPSTATISVLIKAFALSKSWSYALDILEAAPVRYGIWPEARVYGQLAQYCAKENSGNDAVASYIAMVKACGKEGIAVKSSISARLKRTCAQCGHYTRAAKISKALTDSDGHVDQKVLDVLEVVA